MPSKLEPDNRNIIKDLALPFSERVGLPFVGRFPFICEDSKKQNLMVFQEKGQLLEPESVKRVFLRIAGHEVVKKPGQVFVF